MSSPAQWKGLLFRRERRRIPRSRRKRGVQRKVVTARLGRHSKGCGSPRTNGDAWIPRTSRRACPRSPVVAHPAANAVSRHRDVATGPESSSSSKTNRHTRAGDYVFPLPVRRTWNYLRNSDLRHVLCLAVPAVPRSRSPGCARCGTATEPYLVPKRAQARLAGHPWPPGAPSEDWFWVVPVLDLWDEVLPGVPAPVGAAPWSKERPRPGRRDQVLDVRDSPLYQALTASHQRPHARAGIRGGRSEGDVAHLHSRTRRCIRSTGRALLQRGAPTRTSPVTDARDTFLLRSRG